MAHKKGGGSSRNGRDSAAQRLGVKVFDGQVIPAGSIIVWSVLSFVLLLAGIAVSALAGSMIGLVSYIADDSRLRDLTLWQMGSLAAADDTRVWLALAAAAALAWRFQRRAAA